MTGRPTTTAGRFARAIQRRHARRGGDWPSVHRVVLLQRAWIAAVVRHHGSWQPHISLRLAIRPAAVAGSARPVRAPTGAPARITARRILVEQRSERIRLATDRIETPVARPATARSRSGTAEAVLPLPGVSSLPMTVRRPAVPPAAVTRGEPLVGAARAPVPAPPMPPELPPAEVHRLTEHVLRTLDRRVAAFRERHGRV